MPFRISLGLVALAILPMTLTSDALPEADLGEVALRQAQLDLGTDLRLMCVAAHPDDEDGSTLAMYRKKWGYKTFALIATRGEGGQNEIGPELYNELGVIRTHEMKRAAEITGAELHFLDLPEFGFSKSADETYEIWGRDEPVRRMVRKIRELKPDVIITHHGPTGGHGHHQVVGRMLLEAFDAAADPNRFPEQLKEGLEPWQVARFYQRPFGGSNTGANDTVAVNDTSELDPLRGRTYAEIAGQALHEHASQGMGFFVGRFLSRRSSTTYYLHKEAPDGVTGGGDVPAPGGALFEGLNDRVSKTAREIATSDLSRLELKDAAIAELKRAKDSGSRARANNLAAKAMQLALYANADDSEAVPGQSLSISISLADYGESDATGAELGIEAAAWFHMETPPHKTVTTTESYIAESGFTFLLPEKLEPTIPHPEKLFEPHFLAPQFTVVAKMETGGTTIELREPVLIDIAPNVSAVFSGAPYLVRQGVDEAITVELMLTNHFNGPRDVEVVLSAAPGLTLEQDSVTVSFAREGDQKVIPLQAAMKPGIATGDYAITATISGGAAEARGIARVVDVDVPENIRVGVVQSYDDTFMTTLERLRVPHAALQVDDFTPAKLDTFSTIILDIRAFLVRPDVAANNEALFEYVKRGGTVIVNYHKNFEWNESFAPYPISISRNRVTVEDAPIKMLVPDHPLFNTPNKIGPSDWDGWIQERGLYFPNRWDDAYTPLIEVNDPGENNPPGSCLIAQYGEGKYLYTALGWYRQLRELHPGTLRIFANMLAL